MKRIFLPDSPYKHWARWMALGWTLLIFVLFMMPSSGVPKLRLPLPHADKFVHLGFFALLCFLWMAANPTRDKGYARLLLITSLFFGWMVEYLQGHFAQGRSQDYFDLIADVLGSALGIGGFRLLGRMMSPGQGFRSMNED